MIIRKYHCRLRNAQVLVEVVVALGILVMIASAFARLTIGSYDGGRQGREQTIAANYASEGFEAALSIARDEFDYLIDGTHGIEDETGVYTLSGSSNTLGKYTRTLTIEPAARDKDDNIVTSGGLDDIDSKKVTSEVSWNVSDGRANTVSYIAYLTTWYLGRWVMDLLADFDAGYINATETTEVDDGEVRHELLGDFTDPSVLLSTTIPGNGDPMQMRTASGTDILFVSTLQDGGDEFFAYDISDIGNGNLTLIDSVDMAEESRSFDVTSTHAFVLTKDSSREVRVVPLYGASAYTIVADWDLLTGAEPYDIVVDESADRAYVVTKSADYELLILDISNPESEPVSVVGQAAFGFDARAVDVAHGYAYIATINTSSELVIVDLSNTNNVTQCNLNGSQEAYDVQVEGTSLFVGRKGGEESEFIEYQINSSDPDDCSYITSHVVGEASTGGDDVFALYADMDTNLAFLATDNSSQELVVVDLTDYSDTEHNIDGGDSCYAVTFLGNSVYVGCKTDADALQVINGGGTSGGGGSDLTEVGSADTTGDNNGDAIFASGSYVYIGTVNSGGDNFFIYDISSPSAGMSPVGTLNTGGNIYGIAIQGNYAYLATSNNSEELLIIDISNPGSLNEVGAYDSDEGKNGTAVAISGNYAYLGTANNTGGGDMEFYVLDVSNPGSISLEDTYETSSNIYDIIIDDGTAYVGTDSDGTELRALDISDPQNVTQLDSMNLSGAGDIRDLAVNGDALFIARDNDGSENDFHIIDITTPSSLSVTSSLNLVTGSDDNYGVDIDADNSIAYVATEKNGEELIAVNISTLASPVAGDVIDLSGNSRDVSYNGSYICVSSTANAKELIVVESATAVGGSSDEYSHWATYTSPTFDTEIANATWKKIKWRESGSGSVSFRVRTANTEANLDSAVWVGSDGTRSTVYTQSGGQIITTDSGASGTRWLQFKGYFTGDGTGAAVLDDATLTFEEP